MASTSLMLFSFLTLLGGLRVICYRIDVTVMEEDGVKDFTKYYAVDKDVPPFGHFPTDKEKTDVTSTADGVMTTGVLGNVRHKRSPRVGSTCRVHSGDNPNHVVAVEKGEIVHLPCYTCNTTKDNRLSSMQWVKLNYSPSKDGLYRVHEVLPGLHMELKKNRITISVDHTLSISQVRLSDSGSYFCKPPDKKNFLDLRLSWRALMLYMADYSHIQTFYHLDVVENYESEVDDVSEDSNNSPRAPDVVPGLNIVTETTWHNWGECNICGGEGVRKRIGLCTVRKHQPNCKIPNKYLEYVLSLSPSGLTCKSQFLKQFANEKWLHRRNEFQRESCFVECPSGKSRRRKRSISKSEILEKKNFTESVKGEPDVKKEKKKVKIGEFAVLKCPGAKLGRSVVWLRKNDLLPETTLKRNMNQRYKFDIAGRYMHFKSIIEKDAGEYSCWVENKLKASYELIIKSEHTQHVWEYLMYLLCSFGFDLVVFIFLACVRACGRKVQRRRRKKKSQEESNENEEENEEENVEDEENEEEEQEKDKGEEEENEEVGSEEETEDDEDNEDDEEETEGEGEEEEVNNEEEGEEIVEEKETKHENEEEEEEEGEEEKDGDVEGTGENEETKVVKNKGCVLV